MSRYVVRRRNNGLGIIIVLAAIALVLAVTNPKKTDFESFVVKQRRSEAPSALGTFGKDVKGFVGSLEAGSFDRNNYILASTFENSNATYLGFGKVIFFKVK